MGSALLKDAPPTHKHGESVKRMEPVSVRKLPALLLGVPLTPEHGDSVLNTVLMASALLKVALPMQKHGESVTNTVRTVCALSKDVTPTQ